MSATGAAVETVEVLKDGLVGRGVLLDIPRARNVDWLEPGESVLPADLDEAGRARGSRSERATSCWSGRAMRGASTSWPRTRPARRPGCTRPARFSWPSGGSRHSAATATAIPRRASPRGSAFRSTSSHWSRSASTCSTTCTSRNRPEPVRRRAAGTSSSSGRHCAYAGGTGSPESDRDPLSVTRIRLRRLARIDITHAGAAGLGAGAGCSGEGHAPWIVARRREGPRAAATAGGRAAGKGPPAA